MAANLNCEIAHGDAFRSQSTGILSPWSRQLTPHALQLGDRSRFTFGRLNRFFNQLPDHWQIARTDLRVGGHRRQSCGRLAQGGAVLIVPRGLKIISVVGRLAQVEVDDALDRVLLAIGFA